MPLEYATQSIGDAQEFHKPVRDEYNNNNNKSFTNHYCKQEGKHQTEQPYVVRVSSMLGRKPQIRALGKRSRSPDGTWFLPSDMGVVDSHLSGESETNYIECLRLEVIHTGRVFQSTII